MARVQRCEEFLPRVRPFRLACLAVLALLSLGCSNGNSPDANRSQSANDDGARQAIHSKSDAANAESDSGVVSAATSEASEEVTQQSAGGHVALREADRQMFQNVLDRAKGKVVLVDFWATWCVSCKKNFPKTIGYEKKYAPDGLCVVTVSIDDAEEHAAALAFLESVGATSINLRSKWGAGSESVEQFEFSGEVPFYKLYDRKGKLRYQFSANGDIQEGVEPLEQIEPHLLELLKE